MRSRTTVQGRVIRDGGIATLDFEARLDHPPEDVWDAITDPVQLSEWYMMQAAVDGRAGGIIDFSGGPTGYHVFGTILTWDPPRVFEYEWKMRPGPRSPQGEDSVVRWELTRDGEATLLRLTHSKVSRALASGIAPATHVLVERLAALLDRREYPDMQKRFGEVAPLYAAKEG